MRFQNNEATLQDLETQVGQIASMVIGRAQGTLPSDMEKNPKHK